jgi:hypothetical protein
MKLTAERVKRTEDQVEAQAIPESHPAVAQLSRVFGDHTFFVDGEGLAIVEPAPSARDGAEKGTVMRIADWNDPSRTSLTPHEPEATDIVIAFDEPPKTA